MKHKIATALVACCAFFSLASAAEAVGDDWNVQYSTPSRNGDFTTTISIRYTDGLGKKQKKDIVVTSKITRDPANPMTADEKRIKIQQDLQRALDRPLNQVNGDSPVTLAGAGSTLILDPNTITFDDGNGGQVDSGLRIEKIAHRDRTGQEDKVNKPSEHQSILVSKGLAIITAPGSLTGWNSYGTGQTAQFDIASPWVPIPAAEPLPYMIHHLSEQTHLRKP